MTTKPLSRRWHRVIGTAVDLRRRVAPLRDVMQRLGSHGVLYVEPAKWVAKLRATKTGASPLLLKTEMTAGHGGVSGRYARWKEAAFEYAWVLCTAGASGE